MAAASAGVVLVADDQSDVREALRLLLKAEGFEARSAASPAAVLEAVEREELDLALIDLNYARDTTSGAEGLDLLKRIQAADPGLPVLVMTAWASVELAVEAMRRGARDFVQKPWENARLIATVRTQVELARALREGRRLQAANRLLASAESPGLLAVSKAMQPVLELIERVGPSDASVLITGENGTGKGLVARALHAVSPRAGRPLVTVNAGGLSPTVFESELFGHVRGAFTDAHGDRAGRFEIASGGTLFLDEIGNVGAPEQARLLRVLETGEYEPVGSSRTRRADVRILSASNADLEVEVGAGRFRRDLLFRLRTVEIHLPPLRERREDINPLAAAFLERHARHHGKAALSGFEPSALAALLEHAWPGNVRELDHAVERAVLMARGAAVAAEDLGLTRGGGALDPRGADLQDLKELSLEDVERLLIRKALARHDGSVTRAAEALGLSRSALYRRIEKHGL